MRYCLLSIIALFFMGVPGYPEPIEKGKQHDIEAVPLNFFDDIYANPIFRSREMLCSGLPPVAAKRPNLTSGLTKSNQIENGQAEYNSRVKMHVLLHMLFEACRVGALHFEPSRYGYVCLSDDDYFNIPWLGHLFHFWRLGQEHLFISCIKGTAFLDGVKLKSLSILGSEISFSIARSVIDRIVLNSFPAEQSVKFKISNSELKNDLILSGFGDVELSIISTSVGDSVYANQWLGKGTIQIFQSHIGNQVAINRPDDHAHGHDDESTVHIRDVKMGSLDLSNLGNGSVICEDCQVARSIFIRRQMGGTINFRNARIENGISFSQVRLSESSKIDLANVKARYLEANRTTFKFGSANDVGFVDVNLDGARFDSISGSGDKAASLLAMSSSEWIDFLEKSQKGTAFNPQPYFMIAQILSTSGFKDTANDLNVKRVELTLTNSGGLTSWIKWLAGLPTGYGYKPDTMLSVFVMLPFLAGLAWMLVYRQIAVSCAAKRSRGLTGPRYVVHFGWTLFVLALVYSAHAFVRLVPSFQNSTRSPRRLDEKILGKRLANPDQMLATKIYTFIGSLLIFFLVTPLTGLFD